MSLGLFDFFNSFFFQNFIFFNKNFFLFSKNISSRPRIPVKNWIFEGVLFWCPNLGEENFNFYLIKGRLGLFLLKTRDKLNLDKGVNLRIFINGPRFGRLRVGGKIVKADFFNKLEYYCLAGVPKISLIGLGGSSCDFFKKKNLFFYLGRV